MVTGILIGWKGSKPQVIEAGNKIGSMTEKFKALNIELLRGKCKYDKVELFKNAFKTAIFRKPVKEASIPTLPVTITPGLV
jgi:hypothetical protein